jgi:hypothetical protein
MMDLIKSFFALVTSFFTNSTAKKKEELSLADTTEKAVVEEIRATANVVAVEQLTKLNEDLAILKKQYKKDKVENAKKSLDDQINDQFSKDN